MNRKLNLSSLKIQNSVRENTGITPASPILGNKVRKNSRKGTLQKMLGE